VIFPREGRDELVDALPETVVALHELHADARLRSALRSFLGGYPVHDDGFSLDGGAARQLQGDVHQGIHRRRLCGPDEQAPGADVRRVLAPESVDAAEPHREAGRVPRRGTTVDRARRLFSSAESTDDARLRRLVAHEIRPEPHGCVVSGASSHAGGHLDRALVGKVDLERDALPGAGRHHASHEGALRTQRPGGRLHHLRSCGKADRHDVRTGLHVRPVGPLAQSLSAPTAKSAVSSA